MITVRVEGGLGNQFFMYAMGRALSLRSGMALRLDAHNGQYGALEPFGRSFLLDRHAIAASIAAPDDVCRFGREAPNMRRTRRLERWMPRPWRTMLQEPRGGFARIGRPVMRRSTYVTGYWQDERHFLDAATRIAEELEPREPMRDSVLERARSLEDGTAFVHVRRKRYPHLLPSDYYTRAIEIMRGVHGVRRFVVFGDDPTWASEHLARHDDVQVATPGTTDEIEDLWLMSRCRFGIVANSSFSWWAAWKAMMREATRPIIAPAAWGYATRPSDRWTLLPASLEPGDLRP